MSTRNAEKLVACVAKYGWGAVTWVDDKFSARGTVHWATKLKLGGVQVWTAEGASVVKAHEKAATEYLASVGVA